MSHKTDMECCDFRCQGNFKVLSGKGQRKNRKLCFDLRVASLPLITSGFLIGTKGYYSLQSIQIIQIYRSIIFMYEFQLVTTLSQVCGTVAMSAPTTISTSPTYSMLPKLKTGSTLSDTYSLTASHSTWTARLHHSQRSWPFRVMISSLSRFLASISLMWR